MNSNRTNDLFFKNTYTNEAPISSYNQYINNDPTAYFSGISTDYLIKPNQIINLTINYDILQNNNKTEIVHKSLKPDNNIGAVLKNTADNHSFYSGLTYSNSLSANLLLSVGTTFYDESININNTFLHVINQRYLFNKEAFDAYVSIRYKIIPGLNTIIKSKYNIINENLSSSLKRDLDNTGVNFAVFGNKIAKKFTYDASIGLEKKIIDYNKRKIHNFHLPFSLNLNYENRLSRVYFNSYQTYQMSPMENAIDMLKSNNNMILANDKLPANYSGIFKTLLGYSYNNFFLGNNFDVSISYQKVTNPIKEGFQNIDENGVYQYIIMMSDKSEEYKFMTRISKNMFKYTQFPIVAQLGLNLSQDQFPIYISDNFYQAKNTNYSFNLKLQSISKKIFNFEARIIYANGISEIVGNSLKNNRFNVDSKVIYKKGNIHSELGYMIFYEKITDQSYIRQSLRLKADYLMKKLIVSIEGNNIENILGIFNNSSYNTKYSVLDGISRTIVLNEALSYIVLKLKFNY